jgi:putative sugar O-methyltransferase
MKNPLIGNPIGFEVDGAIFTADSFRHNFYARRIADLLSDIEKPAVLEIGGGFDGVAYHLLSRIRREFKYIDFDLPAVAILAAYFLLTAFPSMRIGLYGEVGSADPFRAYDVVIFPNFALPWLTDMSADLCFNSCSFAEMDELTVREYMRQFERICRRFIMHQNHSWVSGTRNGCYEPMGRFKHWNLSLVEPNPSIFKRVHKITSPFQGDLYAEFFEWLYERR